MLNWKGEIFDFEDESLIKFYGYRVKFKKM